MILLAQSSADSTIPPDSEIRQILVDRIDKDHRNEHDVAETSCHRPDYVNSPLRACSPFP
jgi:hypothetical protein